MKNKKNEKSILKQTEKNKAITLIALVVTIIVLIILAGVSINLLLGENGIITKAKDAKVQTAYKAAEEKVKLAIMGARADDGQMTVAELKTEIANYKGSVTGDNFPVEVQMDGYIFTVDENGIVGTPKPLPKELEIGSTVAYTPSGTYTWRGEYCSTSQSDTTLNSAEANFKISEWKVLDIENGKVTLVPTAPTTGTVYLGQAQGYNNGVKLLNDACSSLYGNSAKGITARSLNIEDIEKYMTEEALASAHEYTSVAKYGEQVTNPYTSNKNYPVMYAKENLSVIDGNKNTNGLGMSEQTDFIEKTENGATDGKITTATSIQPYQTDWDIDSDMQKAFKTATNGTKYYNLIMPKGSYTSYWLASHSIHVFSDNCLFYLRSVDEGYVSAGSMLSAYGSDNYIRKALFPVVSLSSELISRDATTGFSVQ